MSCAVEIVGGSALSYTNDVTIFLPVSTHEIAAREWREKRRGFNFKKSFSLSRLEKMGAKIG
jgi:predicted peroxiredoxin